MKPDRTLIVAIVILCLFSVLLTSISGSQYCNLTIVHFPAGGAAGVPYARRSANGKGTQTIHPCIP